MRRDGIPTEKPTRRRFLKIAVAVPLAGVASRLPAPLRCSQAEELFENPHFIRYDASCFTINDRDTFIFSAAFHYPRCPRALWRDRLLKLQRAGFNTIETYVFWNYHEREEGRVDLTEFEDFVKLMKEMGFFLIARPGPYVCAEWQRGGIPDWVAAKRFPLRSNHPESIRWSQYWFNQALPVIQRHQITVGGPIILVQVENEYDFWPLPDADKREYLRLLARLVWNAGINVPVITCWTKQARENSDPDMARIMDTCNFYPRWNIAKEVPPALAKLRQEEPNSPLGVTELQGGWFSQFGGEAGKITREQAAEILSHLDLPQKPTLDQFIAMFSQTAGKLSVEQEGVSGAQLNMLTKTVIEQGVTYFNYYMGCGGTNFDWAAKTLTTTYDYAAPIREPGGLWEKYYAARGIGAALAVFGNVLTRAQLVEPLPQSTNPNVSVTERVSGKNGVVFVRENANAEQRFKMQFQDSFSPTKRVITTPREGELVIGPREMKMLPVGIPIPGSILRYTTAEVLAAGLLLDRHLLIVYDEPGRVAEISLATTDEPKIEGDFLYSYWDPEYESVVFGVRVEKAEKILLVNNHLLVVVLPRALALRSWTTEFPCKVVPGAEEPKPMLVPFLGDSYLLAGSGSSGKRIWAELDFLPGEHQLTVLLPPQPSKCFLNGLPMNFEYERSRRAARLSVSIPGVPYRPITLNQVQAWTEKFDASSGDWLSSPLRALEDLGPVPYGYVKYRAQFTLGGQSKMFISAFGSDFKRVFLNGKLVPEASNANKSVEFELAKHAASGINTIDISYERFGSSNGGPGLGELSGIESVRCGESPQDGFAVEAWQIQRFPAPMRGRDIDPEFPREKWRPATLTEIAEEKKLVPAFTWCRAEFALEAPSAGWLVPWKVNFEAERDALLYLNGKFVGRYVTVGPQKEFYLPEPYLLFGGKKNYLTIILAYADQPNYIRTLRLTPYEEFSVRRTRIEFEW